MSTVSAITPDMLKYPPEYYLSGSYRVFEDCDPALVKECWEALRVDNMLMMVTAKAVAAFIERHPTVKMLALSFLLLVGVALMAESFDAHLPRGYIYSAMGFSIFVEMLNLRMRRNAKAVRLYDTGPS